MMADNTRVTITKLNNDNYQVWKFKVELLLIKEDLWNIVSQEPPAEEDAAWTRKDGQARATIGLLVEDNSSIFGTKLLHVIHGMRLRLIIRKLH